MSEKLGETQILRFRNGKENKLMHLLVPSKEYRIKP
jgi:hypothetical protein